MDGYRKRYLAISRKDFDQAEPILDKFYNRGDIDRITVEFRAKCDPVLIGLECSTDDYLLIAEELGIKVL
jgi:hypothetical protein